MTRVVVCSLGRVIKASHNKYKVQLQQTDLTWFECMHCVVLAGYAQDKSEKDRQEDGFFF